MRSGKLGAGNRHGIISHIGISETDSLTTKEDAKKAKKQNNNLKKSNLQPFRIKTNSST